jgi:hypothetical protein
MDGCTLFVARNLTANPLLLLLLLLPLPLPLRHHRWPRAHVRVDEALTFGRTAPRRALDIGDGSTTTRRPTRGHVRTLTTARCTGRSIYGGMNE